MKLLPLVHTIQMEGTVSQIFDIGHSFYFMIKNRKLFVVVFLTFTLHFIKCKTRPKLKFWDTVSCIYILRIASERNDFIV